MKVITTLFINLFVLFNFTFGQEGYYEHSFSADDISTLEIDAKWGDLKLEAWDQDEVVINGKVLINGQPNSQAFEITNATSRGILKIKIDADMDDLDRTLTIRKADGSKIYLNQKDITIQDYKTKDGEAVYWSTDVEAQFIVKVPRELQLYVNSTYGDVQLEDYFTNLEVENTYGSVDARFKELPNAPKIYISSTYSHVDVSLPQETSAELSLQSGYGKIFTDLDFDADYNPGNSSSSMGQDISAMMNKGSGSVKLKAEYNNIYLREYLSQ